MYIRIAIIVSRVRRFGAAAAHAVKSIFLETRALVGAKTHIEISVRLRCILSDMPTIFVDQFNAWNWLTQPRYGSTCSRR
jgi:hypothetical protein